MGVAIETRGLRHPSGYVDYVDVPDRLPVSQKAGDVDRSSLGEIELSSDD